MYRFASLLSFFAICFHLFHHHAHHVLHHAAKVCAVLLVGLTVLALASPVMACGPAVGFQSFQTFDGGCSCSNQAFVGQSFAIVGQPVLYANPSFVVFSSGGSRSFSSSGGSFSFSAQGASKVRVHTGILGRTRATAVFH